MLRSFVAAAITAVTLLLLVAQFASMPVDSGVLPTPIASGSCDLVVGSMATGGAATGLDRNDLISGSLLDKPSRIFLTTGSARVGSSFRIPVLRDDRPATVIVSLRTAPSWTYWLIAILSKLIIYCVGALVLWRGRDSAAFFFGISSLAISVAIYPMPSSVLAPDLQVAYAVVARSLADIAALNLFLMVEYLSRDALSKRGIIILRSIVIGGVALGIADNVFSTISRVQTGCVNPLLAVAHPVAYMAVLSATLVALTLAYFRSSGETRARLRWIYVSTFVGFTGVLAYLGGQVLNRPIPAYPVMNVTAIAIPIGYAYAILRHRVIDVGFAINRAIIFTAMTTVVVAAFALLSSVLERAAVGPSESVALQVAVALVLALSFNALEKRVESVIDQIFFRRKHRAQAELSHLADEIPFMHGGDALLDRVVATVRAELGSSGVAVYHGHPDRDYVRERSDGFQYPESVNIDDPAFVRLRTYLRDVDLSDVDSGLAASGIAFPLAVQGRLSGALIVGPRRSEEAYDPDERAIVRALAVRIAATLEALRARQHAQLLKAIADGSLGADEARSRAKSLLSED